MSSSSGATETACRRPRRTAAALATRPGRARGGIASRANGRSGRAPRRALTAIAVQERPAVGQRRRSGVVEWRVCELGEKPPAEQSPPHSRASALSSSPLAPSIGTATTRASGSSRARKTTLNLDLPAPPAPGHPASALPPASPRKKWTSEQNISKPKTPPLVWVACLHGFPIRHGAATTSCATTPLRPPRARHGAHATAASDAATAQSDGGHLRPQPGASPAPAVPPSSTTNAAPPSRLVLRKDFSRSRVQRPVVPAIVGWWWWRGGGGGGGGGCVTCAAHSQPHVTRVSSAWRTHEHAAKCATPQLRRRA